MNRISARQLFFFLACIAPVGKLVLMPAQLVHDVGNDLLFPAAINCLLQSGAVFCVLTLVRSQKSFYTLVAERAGRAAAKIILALLMLFLFYAAIMPILEQSLLVQNIFYDTLPSVLTFAPFFLFSLFLCAKPLSCRGRLWDLLGPLAIVAFVGVLAFSVGQADFGALLPAGISGVGSIFKGAARSLGWFCDSAILLVLLGKLEYRKGIALRGMLFYLLGGAAVLLFLAVFYGVFSDIALRQIFAFTKISKYFSGITVLGRIDFLFIYLLAFVMAFYCSLPLHACVECANLLFGDGKVKTPLYSAAVNAVMFSLTVLLNLSFLRTGEVILYKLFWIFLLFCLLLPVLSVFLRRTPHEKF